MWRVRDWIMNESDVPPKMYFYCALLVVAFCFGGYCGAYININRTMIKEILNDEDSDWFRGLESIQTELQKDDSDRLGLCILTKSAVYVVRNINKNFDIACGIYEKSKGEIIHGSGFQGLK